MTNAGGGDLRQSPVLRAASEAICALAFGHALSDELVAAMRRPEWSRSLRMACGIHGLGALLGLRVLVGERLPLPDADQAWLAEQPGRNMARHQRLAADLDAVVSALVDAGAQPVALKGAAMLLRDAPAELAWRPMSDLDLLVSVRGRRDTVRQSGIAVRELDLALAHAGYCVQRESWKHRAYGACAPGPPLVTDGGEHPDNPRDVEIHRRVVEQFRGYRWDITPVVCAAGVVHGDVRVPSDGAMALHLAAHASVTLLEGMHRAIHLIDLARALERSGLAPVQAALQVAGARQGGRFVYPALALTARETGSSVAAALAEELVADSRVPSGMVSWCAAVSLFDASWAGQGQRGVLGSQQVWARDASERLRMTASTLVPTPAVLSSDAYGGDGPLAWPGWYARHYLRLARRVTPRLRRRGVMRS